MIIVLAILLCFIFFNNKNEKPQNIEDRDKEINNYFPPNDEENDELLNKSIIGIDFGSSFSGFSFVCY